MRIGVAAELVGTSVRALRHYEAEGLFVTGRSPNGYRDFCPTTVVTARTVRGLLDHGLPTRLVRELLPHLEAPPTTGVTPCPEVMAQVRGHRDRLDRRIAVLTASRDALDVFLRESGETRAPAGDRPA